MSKQVMLKTRNGASRLVFLLGYNAGVTVSKITDRFKVLRQLREMLKSHNNGHRDLCFVDIETTGPRLGFHEIIDLAAIRTTLEGHVKRQWHRRIKPRHPERASAEATKINGFSIEKWSHENEASFELWEDFASVARDSVAVCQNPSFDRWFITLAAQEFKVDLGIDYHWIGTESLAWPLYAFKEIPDVKLESICRRFNIPTEPIPHDALNGAKTHLEVYRALMTYYTDTESGAPAEVSQE